MKAMVLSLALALQIAGVVLKRGTEIVQPLANARVELFDGPTRRVARTDSGGRFVFNDLKPGTYRVLVTKDGFIRQEYGQRIPDGPYSRITIDPSQTADDLVFLMQPAPTITGWIRDEYGEVVPGVLIKASRRGYDVRGKRTLTPMESTLSNDRGQYRLYWLDPGEYVISAGSASSSGSIYLQTYYPGFDDPGAAEAVHVKIGREVKGVDFKVIRGQAMNISGYVVNTSGIFAGASVTLQPPGDVASAIRYTVEADPGPGPSRGSFAVNDIPPGTFIVSATQTALGKSYSGYTTLVVRNGKYSPRYGDVRVMVAPAAEIKGRLIPDTAAAVDLSKTQVALASTEPVLPSPIPVRVDATGRFSVTGVQPGSYSVSVTGLPEDAYIKVADEFLEIGPYSAPRSLEVMLGTQGAQVAGRVFDSAGQPRFGAQIVLVPEGDRRGRPNQYRLTSSTADGTFTIRGVPPGAYKIFAWEVVEPFAYLNSDFIKNYESRGTRLNATSGQKISIRLAMIPDEP